MMLAWKKTNNVSRTYMRGFIGGGRSGGSSDGEVFARYIVGHHDAPHEQLMRGGDDP